MCSDAVGGKNTVRLLKIPVSMNIMLENNKRSNIAVKYETVKMVKKQNVLNFNLYRKALLVNSHKEPGPSQGRIKERTTNFTEGYLPTDDM